MTFKETNKGLHVLINGHWVHECNLDWLTSLNNSTTNYKENLNGY